MWFLEIHGTMKTPDWRGFLKWTCLRHRTVENLSRKPGYILPISVLKETRFQASKQTDHVVAGTWKQQKRPTTDSHRLSSGSRLIKTEKAKTGLLIPTEYHCCKTRNWVSIWSGHVWQVSQVKIEKLEEKRKVKKWNVIFGNPWDNGRTWSTCNICKRPVRVAGHSKVCHARLAIYYRLVSVKRQKSVCQSDGAGRTTYAKIAEKTHNRFCPVIC